MVRSYVPKTNIFKLDVAQFERFFSVKATNAQEAGGGASPRSEHASSSPIFEQALRAHCLSVLTECLVLLLCCSCALQTD
jgi:hypothetical protein